MKRIRVISCLVILLFAYNLPIRSIDKTKNLEVLADSARHLLGKSGFVPVNTAYSNGSGLFRTVRPLLSVGRSG